MSDRKTVEKVVEMYEDSMADWERGLPDLVRCKDCVYWNDGYLNYYVHPWLPCMEIRTDRNWFCADGERRTDDA